MAKAKPTAINLDQFAGLLDAQEKGTPISIKGPDGSDMGWTIVMAGPDSSRQRAARRAIFDKRSAAGQASPLTVDDMMEDNREIAAGSVVSWSPDPTFGGAPLPCTPENALAVFSAHPFILDQVIGPVVRRTDFLAKPSTGSGS